MFNLILNTFKKGHFDTTLFHASCTVYNIRNVSESKRIEVILIMQI